MDIIEYVKRNMKTKKGRKTLFIEGISLIIGIAVVFTLVPKEITISGHIGLLILVYIMVSLYYIIKNAKGKKEDSK